jgi:two-component system, NtrC family, sensor histidine kinase HydH
LGDLAKLEIGPPFAGHEPHYSQKWLIPARVLLLLILLSSSVYIHFYQHAAASGKLIAVYYLVLVVALLSCLPGSFFKARLRPLFVYFQVGLDTFIVTLIIFVTGSYSSFFSFMYLVVIIYASMVLYRSGGMLIAALSSIQYAFLVILQYQGILIFVAGGEFAAPARGWDQLLYKILIMTAACFAVALLSGLLAEQNRRSQKELKEMEQHVKRVEKMAYMGEMAAGLAHEIKNPMASLVGSIQMLRDEFHYDADHQRLMEIVLRETDRLSTLVNDFLFFARPPAGKPIKLNIKEAVEEITALFQQDANHAKHFTLVKRLLNHAWVVVEPTHLRQIIWNLLLNAAEAIGDDGMIEIEMVKTKNNEIGIRIKDNGCGMSAEVAQSIFDPFYTTKPEGTGLGLSIVHRILEAYGSRLDVHTRESDGTTVMFALRLTTPPE